MSDRTHHPLPIVSQHMLERYIDRLSPCIAERRGGVEQASAELASRP